MSTPEWTFESLRARVADIGPALHPEERETLWVRHRLLGIARDRDGGHELFLVGPRLLPATATVRRHIQHGEWQGRGDEQFEANRIVLPRDDHFASIVALIAMEFVRFRLRDQENLTEVFHDVEPIIELALRRGALPEETVIGLIGELLAFEEMCRGMPQEARAGLLDGWCGHQRNARDFVLGRSGLEVKTTTTLASSHHINSLSQIEPSRDGQHHERLLLLSIGLQSTTSGSIQLPALVDTILSHLGPVGGDLSLLQIRFLRQVRAYGSAGGGYDHTEMRTWAAYSMRFVLAYTPRIYDLSDPDIRLIRSSDLAGTYVSPDDMTYRIDLPDVVNVSNPSRDWRETLTELISDITR